MLAEAYPASTMPNTSLDSTARTKNAATFISFATRPLPNGRARNPQNAAQNARYGARRNRNLSAVAGATSSFEMSLMPSASDWSSPNGPTRVGPRRSWMRADTLRSAQIAKNVDPPMNPNSAKAAVTPAATRFHGGDRYADQKSGTADTCWRRTPRGSGELTPQGISTRVDLQLGSKGC